MLSVKTRQARSRLDQRLAPLRPISRFSAPQSGWIKAIRTSLGMSAVQLARRMGVASQTVDDMERSEANEAITLATLRRAAAALECSLVYALVPNETLAAIVKDRARAVALTRLRRVDRTMALEAQDVPDTELNQRLDDFIDDVMRDRDLWTDP